MISCGTSWRRSSRCRCSTVEAMQPSSSRAGMTTVSFSERQRASGRRAAGRPCRINAAAETSSQSGLLSAWPRISSRMSSVVRDGAQSQTSRAPRPSRAPSRECRTAALRGLVPPGGRRGGRGTTRSPAPAIGPSATPPLTLTIRGPVQSLAAICRSISGTRSAGCRQSRTWCPWPPNPM